MPGSERARKRNEDISLCTLFSFDELAHMMMSVLSLTQISHLLGERGDASYDGESWAVKTGCFLGHEGRPPFPRFWNETGCGIIQPSE